MKKITLYAVLLLAVIACDKKEEKSIDEIIDTNDLKQIEKIREKVHQDLEKATADLSKIDAAIRALDKEKNSPLVQVITMKDTVFTHYIEINGSVDTRENVIITPEMGGVLTQLSAKAGQNVSKGQILAKVDDGGIAAQLAQAETQLALAKTTFERQQNLWNQKIGSEIQFLQAKTTLESQEKIVAQMKAQLEKTIIRAPFNGSIENVRVERGQVVGAGMELMRIVSLKDMFVTAEVPESYLGKLKNNATVAVQINAIGKTYLGKVRQIGNFINPNNRSFTIEIALPNPDNLLRPNQVAILKIEDYTSENALLVPENIVTEIADGSKVVYTVREANSNNEYTVTRKTITLGYTSGAFVEIKTGLSVGDKVITEGARTIRDGATVKVVE